MNKNISLCTCTQKTAEFCVFSGTSLRFIKDSPYTIGCMRACSDKKLSKALFLLRVSMLHSVFLLMTPMRTNVASPAHETSKNSSSGGAIKTFAAFFTNKLQKQFLEIRGLNVIKGI